MRNKYSKRARISEAKIREVVRYVAADLTALQAAALSGLNRNTVNRLYRGLRERMLLACEAQRPLFGIVEVDESFFGARRVKGRRGRGAYGKTIVFGIFERQGRVYTEIVPDCSKPTLQGIIRGRVDPRTVINSDGWRGYHGLVDLGYGHVRVDHARDEGRRGWRKLHRGVDQSGAILVHTLTEATGDDATTAPCSPRSRALSCASPLTPPLTRSPQG